MKKNLLKKHFSDLDYVLITVAVLLACAGIFFIYSAVLGSGSMKKITVQSFAAVLGIGLMFGITFFDYRILESYVNHIYFACLGILALVLIFGSGKEETGANSWIRFGSVGLQPSELVKVAFSVFFAYKLTDAKAANKINDIKEAAKLTAFYAAITGLVILQNDTGTALVFTFMFVVMFFAAGISVKYILSAFCTVCLLLPAAWFLMAPYQRSRILVFLNPELDPSGAGYQVLQSKIAIGSGGLLGRGYLNGPQNRLFMLPEKETDFIFGVIGEELGFVGCATVVITLLLLILRIFRISGTACDNAGSLICVGLGAMFLFHFTENLCMCLGLLPVTGIPLPFLSYGGSSLVTSFSAVGLVLNIRRVSRELSFCYKYD